ncbi:DUF4230 domain-containing protein [Pleomorphovibrio marinus]|uniref:DUF4230 domain-containing protein n=1 Tax=Pleomorphovibrio marinus TaxID=2164132 RepID=UPI000E0A4AFF|nr:DUF4230 domain-containing protein [Pleomorphovibrio marinus]
MRNKRLILIASVAGYLLGLFSCHSDDRAMVVGKIQQASDLVTSEFTVDKVVYGKKTKRVFFIPLNETTFLAYSQAKVKTGINLSNILEEDVVIEGKKITLHLPPVEVVNFSYPPSSFVEDTLISNTNRFLNNISLQDQEDFFRSAELDIRESLQYMGMVKTSQENTRKLIQTLLSSFGFDEIYIHFKSDSLRIKKVNLENDPDNVQR